MFQEESNGRRLGEWADATGGRAGRRFPGRDGRPEGSPSNWHAEERDPAGKVEGNRQGRAGRRLVREAMTRMAMPAMVVGFATGGGLAWHG
jgi:hypothetical protein